MSQAALELSRFLLPPLAFLCGSVPFANLVARAWSGIDIREHGSGNPGASNVFRVVGPGAGVLVLVLDALKGALPVYLAGSLALPMSPDAAIWYRLLVGFLAGAGHVWSPFLGFRGGKGVATFAGVFLVLFPKGILVALLVAALAMAVFRIFSAGSLVGVLSLPVSYFIFTDEPWRSSNLPLLGITVLAALIILVRHTDNLKRILRGEEFGMLKKDAQTKK